MELLVAADLHGKLSMKLSRRRFGQLVSGSLGIGAVSRAAQTILPDPQQSGIEHVVVVMLENRSFDHLLGWIPGADGRQSGLSYVDNSGAAQSTYPLAPDYTGCGHPDPDHSYGPDRVAYNNGQMDGFLRAGSNDIYTIGYYTAKDIPFYAAFAGNYTVCDRSFASILGPTVPNRMFLWAAQTDRLDDSIGLTNLPTIFDRLAAAGVSHQYYFNNLPFLGLWGFKYLFSARPFSRFLASAAAGTLPAVSFVDPNFTILDDGTGNDDHPHGDIRNADAFLSTIFRALTASPKWRNTVFIVTFDEWGGFFEHVAPPRAVAPNSLDRDQVDGQVLLGFRVPTVIASPFTRSSDGSPNVSSMVFDHTSILKLIEWRWKLAPLTARDASDQIGNPAAIMNFDSPDSSIPALPVSQTVSAAPCFESGIFSPGSVQPSPWSRLAATPALQQWLAHPRFASTSM
jgi:phospholipase C